MESPLILTCWAWKAGKCTEDIGILLVPSDTHWCDLLSLVNLKHRKLCFNNGLCPSFQEHFNPSQFSAKCVLKE